MLDRPYIVESVTKTEFAANNAAGYGVAQTQAPLAVGIPVYNNVQGLKDLLQCLALQTVYPELLIINITCPPEDPNYELIKNVVLYYATHRLFKSRFLLLEAKERQSVSQAWNAMLLLSDRDILLVNDDITFTTPHVLKKIATRARKRDSSVAALEFSGFSCVVLPRMGGKVGFFDPSYFPAYFEDIDYGQRILRLGLHAEKVDLGGEIHHAGSRTINNYDQARMHELHHSYFIRNRDQVYAVKWGGQMGSEALITVIAPVGDASITQTVEQAAKVALESMLQSWSKSPTSVLGRLDDLSYYYGKYADLAEKVLEQCQQ